MAKDTAGGTLLRVENLSVDFQQGASVTHAVKSISFDIARGETVALVGEVRLRQDRHGAVGHEAAVLPGRLAPLRPHPVQGPRRALRQRGRGARTARQSCEHDLPGAAKLAQPAARRRPADRRNHPRPSARAERQRPADRGGNPRDRHRPAAQIRHPGPGGEIPQLSASAFRRPAPARHDRHGAGQQAGPADRRRADHRAGRHHSGANPGAAEEAQGRNRHGAAC